MTGELNRSEALLRAGLTASADHGMDRFARLVARFVRVPVALVSLLETDRQVFPGMAGLKEPWAGRRETPLNRSFCQLVVDSGAPLVVPDTREDPRTRGSLAVSDLQVIAYAGMPLTDADGHVLGALCAIDHRPRDWSETRLQDLSDLAAACSVELQLRIAGEQIRRDRDHAGVLLRASVELGRSQDRTDLVRRLRHLFDGATRPFYVGLLLADGPLLRRVVEPDTVQPVESALPTIELDARFPSARAMREQRTVLVRDRAELAAGYGPDAVTWYEEMGLRSAFCVPLAGRRGVLTWAWSGPHRMGVTEEAVLTAVAGYVSQAVERTLFVENRLGVAQQLQSAMLTELPDVPGLEMSHRYLPAADQDMVGGDWYDAYPLPPGGDERRPCLMLSIGDVIGHDMHAAVVMGQVRSMLRQATLGHAARSPAVALRDVDAAFDALGLGPGATAVHARLDPHGDGWLLTWSNAGHPPPLLRTPDGRVTRLKGHDLLLLDGSGTPDRHESVCGIPPGGALLLYTDGLVERPDGDIDTGIDRAACVLAAHGGGSPDELLEALAGAVGSVPQHDDVAVLALRVTPHAR